MGEGNTGHHVDEEQGTHLHPRHKIILTIKQTKQCCNIDQSDQSVWEISNRIWEERG